MAKQHEVLVAVDLGAGSGRVMAGTPRDGIPAIIVTGRNRGRRGGNGLLL